MREEDLSVIRALCAPPWHFSPHRAWAILEEFHLTLDGLRRWEKFAAQRGQKLATYLISKQAAPPEEKSQLDLVREAAEKARARA